MGGSGGFCDRKDYIGDHSERNSDAFGVVYCVSDDDDDDDVLCSEQ